MLCVECEVPDMNKINSDTEILHQISSALPINRNIERNFKYLQILLITISFCTRMCVNVLCCWQTGYRCYTLVHIQCVCVSVCVLYICVYFYVSLLSTMDASTKETIVCTSFKHKEKKCSTLIWREFSQAVYSPLTLHASTSLSVWWCIFIYFSVS